MTSSRAGEAVPYPDFGGREACKGVDPELFFPASASRDAAAPALRVCASCPVWRSCRAYAVAEDLDGVWGGTTDADRRRLRRPVSDPPVRTAAVVVDLVERGLSVDQAAAELGIAPSTAQTYLSRMRRSA